MHESQILDALNAITLGRLSHEEQSIITADIHSELQNNRLAGSITQKIMEKLSQLSDGLYKESQSLPKTFQDFSENEKFPKPFEIINQKEIDDFFDKMMSKEMKNNFFGDTHEFYHPEENFRAEGQPRHRSDFNQK